MPEDTKSSLPLIIPAGSGKPRVTRAKHGIHSWVDSKRLPKGRAFAKTRRELGQLRTALIERRGGDSKITPEELILIDSVIEALGVQKLLGLYVKQYGVVDEQSAKRGRLELTPILSKSWVSYANVCRQAILALESLKGDRRGEAIPDIQTYIAEFDRRKAEEEAAGGPEDAQEDPGKALEAHPVALDGQTPGDEAKDTENEDAPSGGESDKEE